MKKEPVRFGIVGLKRGLCALSLLEEESVLITAVCDNNPATLAAAKETIQSELAARGKAQEVRYFDSYEELLRADVDAVYIANYATEHVPLVIQALEAGKHVISEIPTVDTLEEARALKAAVTAHPELKYMAGENCCYWAFIQAWKQMYRDGKLGQAIYAEAEYLHCGDWRSMKPENYPHDHWRYDHPAIKYLTHSLGPLLDILDDRCVSVSCMVPDVKYNPYRDKPKTGVALFKTAKGAVIRILIGFDAYVGMDHNYYVMGTRGTLETDKTAPLETASSYAKFADVPGTYYNKLEIPLHLSFPGESTAGHGGADHKMLMDFIRCIQEDTPPPLDVDDGIRMSLPGIIAHESSLRGGELMMIPEI